MNQRRRRCPQARLWAELLVMCWRHRPGQTAAVLAVKVMLAGARASNALLLRATVDAIIDRSPAAAGGWSAGAALVAAVTIYLTRIHRLLLFVLVDRVGLRCLHPRILSGIADLEQLDHLEHADFLDRVTVLRDTSWELVFSAWSAVDTILNLVKLTFVVILLGTVSPWLLPLVVFAAAPIWFDQRGQRAVSRAETDTAEALRLQRHLFDLATGMGGKEIRVTGALDEIAGRQARAWDEAVGGRLRAQVHSAAWRLAGWTLFTAGFAAGLALIVRRAAAGQGNAGDVVLAVTVAVSLRDCVTDTVAASSQAIRGRRLVDPYRWLRHHVDAERARTHGDQPAPLVLHDGITFDHVTFTYRGTHRPALDDVCCHLPAGRVTAVVGEYGSGKTTLVKLLCRFYQPDEGCIRVDGVELGRLATRGWRARTSAAFQDFARFQTRFGQAVGLGDLAHHDDQDEIDRAVRAADAQALVGRLPSGLQTQLGQVFDGLELSEGQWQKTALARASMRTDPLLLLLDEPTASIDAPSEHAIFQRYLAHARAVAARTGAVTVIVSHRFSTVTGADHILVLDNGSLIEVGTHAELIARDGRYAELFRIQSTAYATH